jgi:hypothetical protein
MSTQMMRPIMVMGGSVMRPTPSLHGWASFDHFACPWLSPYVQ